jgi:hypothetical protein
MIEPLPNDFSIWPKALVNGVPSPFWESGAEAGRDGFVRFNGAVGMILFLWVMRSVLGPVRLRRTKGTAKKQERSVRFAEHQQVVFMSFCIWQTPRSLLGHFRLAPETRSRISVM